MTSAMETLNIQSLQKQYAPIQRVSDLAAAQGDLSVNFRDIKDSVMRLYADNTDVARFVIESVPDVSPSYCLTLMREQLTYVEGVDETRKTIVCDLVKETLLLNRLPAPPDFGKVFQKYLAKAFKDLQDKTAVLYEESTSKK
jgi:hypothetical protein